MSRVINTPSTDLGPKIIDLAARKQLRQLSETVQMDAAYQAPRSLRGLTRLTSSGVAADAERLRDRLIAKLQDKLQDAREVPHFGQALDGASSATRSPRDAAKLDRLINRLFAEQSSQIIPPVRSAKSFDRSALANSPAFQAVPAAIAFAYVSHRDADDVILVSEDLGFRGMHALGPSVLAMSILEQAARLRWRLDEPAAALRIESYLAGRGALAGKIPMPFPRRSIDVISDGRLVSVKPGRYLVDPAPLPRR